MANAYKRINFSPTGGGASAAAVTYDNTTSGLTATDVQAAVDELAADNVAQDVALSNHITDAADAHDASAISNVPSGNLAATDVQTALDELQTDVDTRATTASLDAHINDATDAHDASAISTTAIVGVAGGLASDVQTVAADLKAQIDTKASITALNDHISDATGAHAASAISNVPAGNLAATDVQAALDELQTDIDTRATTTALNDHISDAVDAHDASAISNVPTGNLAATDVQAALVELQTDVDTRPVKSAGDINETSFALANNVLVAASITGFAFSNAAVRSFQAIVSVAIDGTSDLFEEFQLEGIQKGTDWIITYGSTGDESGVEFDINASGQVTYTSSDVPGFVSGTLKFRAITTSV